MAGEPVGGGGGGGPPPVDPKLLKAQIAGTEQYRNLLFEISTIKNQHTQSEVELLQYAQQRVQTFDQELKQKLQLAQAAGEITNSEQRRNFILKEESAELKNHLNLITTTDATRKRNLESIRAKQRALDKEMTTAIQQHGQEHTAVEAVQQRINSAKSQEEALLRGNLQLNEAAHQSLVKKVSAQIQFREASIATSQHAQSAMRLLGGLSSDWQNTLLGAFTTMTKASMQSQGAIKGLISSANSLVNSLNNAASASSIAGSTIMKIQESTIYMVKEIDKSQVSLRAATGASQEFARGITRAFNDRAIKQMAASYDELYRLQSALFGISKSYSEQTAVERLALDRLGMAASRAGIAYEDFATVIDKSTRIFGQEATRALNQLYNTAVTIGEKPAQVVKAYLGSLDVLAQYSGPRAVGIFQQLVSWQKATGIEAQKLLNIVSQFDTFEGAATSVSRLNTILGGAYFNTLQMLNATESERVRLLHEGFRATNMSWEAMGRFQRRALATAAGFKDLHVAAAFFRGDMEKVAALQEKATRTADAQQRLLQIGVELVPITQRLVRVFQEFGKFAEQLIPYIQAFARILGEISPKTALMYIGLYKLSLGIAAFTFRVTAASIATRGFAAGLGGSLAAIIGLVPMMLVLGGAFSSLNREVHKKGSPPFWQIFGIMAGGLREFVRGSKDAIGAARKLGTTISEMPTEKMIKVASVTRQVGASAAAMSSGAGGARSAAVQAQSTAIAVNVARQNVLPAGGGEGRLPPGVLVTRDLTFNVGSDISITKKVEDLVNEKMRNRQRAAALRST
jgi:hypothetical protein